MTGKINISQVLYYKIQSNCFETIYFTMSENIIFKGKAMGQMLLDFEIKNVPNLVEKIEKKYRR